MFRDREDAARQLAAPLRKRRFHDALVLAIPRGGVVMGAVLAEELEAELDVVLARKLRAPWNPEVALGAVAEDGGVYLNPQIDESLDLSEGYLAEEHRYQCAEIARRKKLFRRGRPPAKVAGRSVIVTDDGIATGATMLAALRVVQAQRPHELIVAVPVASPDRLEEIGCCCDEIVCLQRPDWFRAIGQFYEDFRQVEDEEVVAQLEAFAAPART